MLNRMKRVAAGLLTAVFLFNIAPVSGVNNVAQVEAAKLVTKGKVNSSILNIRTRKSTKAKKITTLKRGAKVTLLSNSSKWVAVKVAKVRLVIHRVNISQSLMEQPLLQLQ